MATLMENVEAGLRARLLALLERIEIMDVEVNIGHLDLPDENGVYVVREPTGERTVVIRGWLRSPAAGGEEKEEA